ncbi:uncharacterized protein LOC122859658 [Aphidius gifuensis]|uniref:uncharacterized protein LOC122859658 n=1 Tax=Aphidius gifuensis TaxID=684658 RepID=UPI001CDD12F7|nr:uncharacterized protein LOC122859658 [Aphidius gifuensis]
MVGCQVMQPIDSCFLKSPNGTTFTVTNSDIIPTYPGTEKMNLDMENYMKRLYSSKNPVRTLTPAINNNFSMGDCFTMFPNAGKSHEGDWTCQLRLNSTKKEITTKVSVIIKESYLMPSYRKNNGIKTLNCTAIPTLPSKINFCQWILRNDSGTYVNTDWNIKTLHNDTSCVINLPDSNGPYKGKWSCSVHFKNDFGDTFHTSNFIEISD